MIDVCLIAERSKRESSRCTKRYYLQCTFFPLAAYFMSISVLINSICSVSENVTICSFHDLRLSSDSLNSFWKMCSAENF